MSRLADAGSPSRAENPEVREEESAPALLVTDVPVPDDSVPVGPSPEEEAAFLAENPTGESFYAKGPAAGVEETEPTGALPPMEDLVKRIPQPARDLMEELFRARFVTVRRVPKAALKA